MNNSILTSRSFVPVMIVVFGLYLFGLRHFTLNGINVNGDALLVVLISACAALTWAIDIGCGES